MLNSKIFISGAWITVFVLCAPLAVLLASVFTPNDFDVYFEAARSLSHGASPYVDPIKITVSENRTADCYYLYPPLLASAFRSLLWFERDTARVIWNIFNLIAVMITGIAGCYAHLWRNSLAPLAALILFALPFSIDAFSTGQVDCVVLACYALLLAAIANGKDYLAGGALAIAVHLKASPILLLIPLFRLSRKRPFYCALLFIFLGGLLLTALHGTGIWGAFMDSSRLVGAGARSWDTPSNRTPAKLLLAVLPSSISVQFANSVILLLSAAVLTFLSRPRSTDVGVAATRTLSIGILLATVTSPIVWYHHLMWLVLPLCIAWDQNKIFSSRGLLIVCSLSLILSLMLDATFATRSNFAHDISIAWSGVLVMVASILCFLLMRRHSQP